mgnify:CR=1 FL=1
MPNPSKQNWYPTEEARPCVDAQNNPIDANGVAIDGSKVHEGAIDFHSMCQDKVKIHLQQAQVPYMHK